MLFLNLNVIQALPIDPTNPGEPLPGISNQF